MPRAGTHRAAAGFTVKSGWASAVLLSGPPETPRVADARIVELSDPEVEDSRQPYHAGFGTAREAGSALRKLVTSVRQFGGQSMVHTLRAYGAAGYEVCGAGLVVGSLVDPESIKNDHIRIHAMEGHLFRGVVAHALSGRSIPHTIWRERDLFDVAAGALGRTEPELRRMLTDLGREVEGGWRGEQKRAALAAWLVLAGRANHGSP
jgi:hypothetical protein